MKATHDSTSTAFITGALKAVDSLRQLEQATEDINYDDTTAATFHRKQLNDAKAFAASFGPLTPEQEGALVAVAEYLHTWMTTAQPNIEPGGWVPLSTLTDDEFSAMVAADQALMDEDEKSSRSDPDFRRFLNQAIGQS